MEDVDHLWRLQSAAMFTKGAHTLSQPISSAILVLITVMMTVEVSFN